MIELAERIQILRRYTTAVRRPMELDELVSLGFVCGEALRAEAKVAELEKDLTKSRDRPLTSPSSCWATCSTHSTQAQLGS